MLSNGRMPTTPSPYFLLGSQSPRRRQLVQLLGYPVQTAVADADEESIQTPDPAQNVLETALLKSDIIRRNTPPTSHGRCLLLTADTTVAIDGQMLNKPKTTADAERMLRQLRGRPHQVLTGIVLYDMQSNQQQTAVFAADIHMRPYSDDEMAAYIATGDPMDKAGAYAIQHPTFRPMQSLNGCYLSVMGLPVCELIGLLANWDLPFLGDYTAVYQQHQGHACPTIDRLRQSNR